MSSATIDPPRNVERCTLCGYLLTGLPDAGRCPECGQTYDQSQIILSGWGGDGLFGQPWHVVLLNALSVGVCLTGTLVLLSRISPSLAPPWLFPIPMLMAVICIRLEQRTHDAVPPIELVLNSNGWLWGYHPAVRRARRIQRLCLLASLTPYIFAWFSISPRFFLIGMAFYSIPISMVLWNLRPRRQIQASPDNLPDRASALVLWQPENRLSIRQVGTERWKVTLLRDTTMRRWSLTMKLPQRDLTFDLPLTQSRLDHLAAQIATWPVELEIIRQQPPA